MAGPKGKPHNVKTVLDLCCHCGQCYPRKASAWQTMFCQNPECQEARAKYRKNQQTEYRKGYTYKRKMIKSRLSLKRQDMAKIKKETKKPRICRKCKKPILNSPNMFWHPGECHARATAEAGQWEGWV